MPRGKGDDEPWDYIYLASLIKHYIAELFPGLILDGVHAFRVTRNSDLYIDEEEAENLLRTIEQELRRSSRGNAVRLEVEADCPADFADLLLAFFDLQEGDLYKLDGPLSMTHLMPLVTNDAFAKLKDRPFQPATDPAFPPQADIFEVMRKQDILLHHPYESFDPVVRFIERPQPIRRCWRSRLRFIAPAVIRPSSGADRGSEKWQAGHGAGGTARALR